MVSAKEITETYDSRTLDHPDISTVGINGLCWASLLQKSRLFGI